VALTDVHVHLAALPTRANGCLLSKRMLRSPLARFLLWRMGLPLDDPETANRRYLEQLEAELAASARVSKAVLLAMDGVYDASGRLDEGRTDFLIANDAVLEAAGRNARLLPGVSINPARRDAVDELERCAAKGARLVKVLPNAQAFDPAEKRHLPFYRALARLRLPILTHVGFEFSLIGQDQSVGDVSRWRAALDEGSIVIGAHGCSNGAFVGERHFPAMAEFVRRYERFFIDSSALTLPNRAGALWRLRRFPEVFDRLLFGTDYPLPCFAFPALAAGPRRWWKARAAKNRFDRQFEVLDSLGIPAGRDFESLFPAGR
jgi:hypothetical protein